MIEDDLFAQVDKALGPIKVIEEPGEEFRTPPLDVLRYYRRPVKLSRLPLIGRGTSVVAVVRQPIDVGLASGGYKALLERVALAVNGRFPPGWTHGLAAIGLTTVVLTPEPIGPADDDALKAAFVRPSRTRVVPLGLIRINLGQEAVSFHLAQGPDGLFPEPIALADAFTETLRRFVPFLET